MATPFGIRRRIKRLFGIQDAAADGAAPRERISLTVVGPKGDEETGSAAAGSTILAASGNLRHPVASGCAQGDCGTCRVEVLEGAENLSEQTDRERLTLKSNKHPEAWRLACRAEVLHGAVKVRAFEVV